MYGFHQDSPSKRRKRTKKAKPLHFVIPDKVAATRAGCETKAEMSDKVTAIGNYVREILNELKVTTVFAIFCCEIVIKRHVDLCNTEIFNAFVYYNCYLVAILF